MNELKLKYWLITPLSDYYSFCVDSLPNLSSELS